MQNSVTTEGELLQLVHQFQALTVFQIVRILGKETTINNIRSKLKRLVDSGLLETQFLPRTSLGGRSPIVYSLSNKGMRLLGDEHTAQQKLKGMLPLQHLLEINDVLIAALTLPRVEPRIAVFEWRHEHQFKQYPIKISEHTFLSPDAFVHVTLAPPYGKPGERCGIIFEIDRGTEDVYTIQNKLRCYRTLFYGDFEQVFGCANLTVAFVVTSGGEARVRQLVRFAQATFEHSKEDAELFIFSSVVPGDIQPLPFFTDPLFVQPFTSSPLPLIEKRGS